MSRCVRQRGTALLSVLLMTVVMGVLVVAILDDVRFGLRRSGNAEAVAQAQRFALGAEALARRRVAELARDGVGTAEWSGKPMLFPIENGLVRASLRDGTDCFNLNSVVDGVPDQWMRREIGVRQYVALLGAIGFSAAQAQALADTLADWIDTDAQRAPLGAEDSTYLSRRPAYRTAGTLLAEPSELRAIHGYEAAIYARIRPYVCALPQAALSPVNVNALAPERAALLTMLTLGAVPPDEARGMLAARPARGWHDPAAFFAQPQLVAANLPNDIYDQVALRSDWFVLEADVEYAGAQVTLNALLQQEGARPARLAARRWTPDE
ncbi:MULTISPECIES: type II secretion system minor pseudopilin GspK [Luteimonas]|uniref:type II secretion system minor pseudopilin GspK n=1 Tax=Luteimonas TaxID=83614 RepID=UPI00210090F3|nr:MULTISPECIES: type II secretion system minor pseudopilin GspK [Luteimonas]